MGELRVKTRDEAEELLGQLRQFYGEPVMPLSKFCRGIHQWGEAMNRDGNSDEMREFGREVVLAVLGRARKSNLLYRIFYLGESPRKRRCPVHNGRWSGCFLAECGCMSEGNVTGWLPDEPDDEDEG